ncbi:hypothetical protein R1917_09750 [Citrobacter koseri]|uniref:hypothetical protein n=1 Tax=Citrobacter koseri TaxID=545 RepID=UPI0029421907|nr:hypothetical protein [Citrobacter koseri]WOJ32592.1 hypothetical protein R1917_09750 [Citrobacter koseri]WOJ36765.1 hypothetical protein R1243_07295 [Citrobacter koseri]
MKSIFDYFSESTGTGSAVGKEFSLYGMSIGKFIGSDGKVMFFEKDGEKMAVPVTITLPQFNIPGPIENPALKDIKEI